ncbi:MAG: exodeoxyribonuclease III [Bdellovibrionales bacterium]|nr:exodeoxyribonuclease III [Bdellovibrionales bacterium]
MKIISWNVNGIRACAEKGFLKFYNEEKPDFFCIQETKAHPDQIESELREINGVAGYFSTARRKGYSGTAIFSPGLQPEQVSYGIGIRKFDFEGRFVVAETEQFKLYNVYFPNGGSGQERHDFKQEFLARFQEHLRADLKAGHEVVVLGDYNVAYLEHDVHDPQKLSKISGFLPEERDWFQGFLKDGFVDTFRHMHPDEEQKFSWWSYRERARSVNRGWRIDHICVSEGLKDRIVRAEVLDQVMGSDHCPVMLELKEA